MRLASSDMGTRLLCVSSGVWRSWRRDMNQQQARHGGETRGQRGGYPRSAKVSSRMRLDRAIQGPERPAVETEIRTSTQVCVWFRGGPVWVCGSSLARASQRVALRLHRISIVFVFGSIPRVGHV